ncbi:MAG: menaquinone biosynthesis protein [Planctomycetes bacterium]|nr:menaquinone biosynthesis protein [Planctomycetota bacterium]
MKPEKSFEFRRFLGRPLRVGGIDYLNSRPLIEAFGNVAGDEIEVVNMPPSELARRLRSRQLDVALVPVVEYFSAPKALPYWIVPGICISSYGAVESIRLFHRVPLGEVKSAALDQSSMTSVLLVRLLFAERPEARWRAPAPAAPSRRGAAGNAVAFEPIESEAGIAAVEGRSALGRQPEAVLLIGDAALEVRPAPGWSFVDLGTEWTRWTGLPFVYAFWVLHGDPVPGLASCFQAVSQCGYAHIDRIVSAGPLPAGKDRGECLRYLSQVIRFRLGPAEIEGLLEFIRRLESRRLLAVDRPLELRFLET